MRLTSQFLRKLQVGELSKQYANFPESYVKRSMEQVFYRTPRKQNYLNRTVERKTFHYGMARPWTAEFRQQNMPGATRKKRYVEPIEEWSFFRGDRVELLVGRDKGKQGIVNQIIDERNWVIVEGLNCGYRNIGADKDYPGVMIKSEKPLLVTTDIALVDPSDLQPTPILWRFTEDGEKVRVSARTGRIIPIPKAMEETVDYKTKNTYIEREKDTIAKVAGEITFEPTLQTFEMEIMKAMGIEEDRIPKKTYWY